MSEQRVKIERLVYGGYGLGYLNGRVIFVPYSAPGDEVIVENISSRKKVQWGSIKQIIIPSDSRTTPFCPDYESCGCCQWQHISYAAQLQNKSLVLADSLRHLAHIKDIEINPCLASPMKQGYRSRVRLHLKYNEEEKGLGFYKPQSHTFVPIEKCSLLPDELNSCLGKLSAYFYTNRVKGLSEIQLMRGSDSQVMITFMLKSPLKPYSWASDLKDIATSGIAVCGDLERTLLWGEEYSRISLDGWGFRVSGGVFFQANISLLPMLTQSVLNAVNTEPDGLGLELYAGVGAFSLPLSGKVGKLITIEKNQQAATDASVNLSINKIENTAVYNLESESGLDLVSSKKPPDLVVVDPPREGLSSLVCRKLKQLSPKQIIYISCNPSTLARDLGLLLAKDDYSLAKIQPLDMFPHTFHIETVASLVKNLL
jgi:23S rRNA (uracil1939-C5)-methyltransferase